jgi:phosphoribosylglycinamide formyltransferase-1
MLSLIAAAQDRAYPAEIALVVSNRPDAPGLATARDKGICAVALDHKLYATREAFEVALHQTLVDNKIDLVCLAGFLRLLTPWFVTRWQEQLINIHPALLPSYKGLHTHERALADGVKIHGCTVHFVVPEMDAGPIIAQAAVPVLDDDTADSLGARVLAQEHAIYPLALALVASKRVKIANGRVIGAGSLGAKNALVAPSVSDLKLRS